MTSWKSQSGQRTQVTESFRETHSEVFGEKPRSNRRSRTVYPADGSPPFEVGEEWEPTLPGIALTPTEGLTYSNLRATDGTDISSRTKHRNYMKANGLALVSDYTESWKKAEKLREEKKSGRADSKQRREIIGRALYEQRRKGRK